MNLALFDLDYTLLTGDSDHAWGLFLVREGVVDAASYRKQNDAFWAQYKDGSLNISEYLAFALAPIAGKRVEDMKPLHDRFLREVIAPMIHPTAREIVARHAADTKLIVTATNTFVTEPIAALFGIPTLIGCDVEIVDGRYTGRSIGVPAFREGKVSRVADWLAKSGKRLADFERSYFYSDSFNDLPLLSAVTHPVAVNPDPTLRAHAEAHGWPIIAFGFQS